MNNLVWKTIAPVFEGMIVDRLSESPSVLDEVFSEFPMIEIDMNHGSYFVLFQGNMVAEIRKEKEWKIILLPGFYINRNLQLFKTYNKILTTIVSQDLVIKRMDNKWFLVKILQRREA